MKKEITLGSKSKDTISGFTGIVVCISKWLNGCTRITIQPQELKDGKPLENLTFDVVQVEVVEEKAAPAPEKTLGGPSITPTRSADPK